MTQTAANFQIALKKQVAKGTRATGSGATGFNVYSTGGISTTKAQIQSETVRRDGQSKKARHGTRGSGAVYPMALSVGTQDILWPAAVRATDWTASFDIDESDFTSITTTTTTIVLASGSALTLGVRRGMVIKLTGHATAGNNGKWIPVLGVTSTTITVPSGYLALNATPDTAVTISIAKHVYNPTAPVEAYYTAEDYGQDADVTELAEDLKLSKVDFEALPDKIIKVTFTFVGRDFAVLSSGSAPNFTSPTYSTSQELVMVDGAIMVNGTSYANILTGMKWTIDMGGEAPPTLGPKADDVFLGNAKISGDFTALRQDAVMLGYFDAETAVEFFLLCSENESDPMDFISFYIGDTTFGSPSKSISATGPLVDSFTFSGGIDEQGSDHQSCTMLISTSAP